MNIAFSKSRFGILSFVFFYVFVTFSKSYALECTYARDSGNLLSVIVPANADLAVSNGYTNESGSQVAAWTDSKVFTNGDPFYFEIEGMWSPWSATYDLIGGDSIKNKQEYAGLQQKKSNAIFCSIDTKNKDIEVFDKDINHKDTEFDYISSILKNVNGKGNGDYEKIYYPEEVQKTCWLTAGEGLYIGFFGSTGLDSPDLATHLKLAEIKCDDKFKKDLNNDGIFTFNECLYKNKCSPDNTCAEDVTDCKLTCTYKDSLDSTNMAYYTEDSARCDSDFYHENKHSNEFPKGFIFKTIGINDCYQDVIVSDNKTIRLDKTLFIFNTGYLYKNTNKDIVGRNEKIKFIIYDNYYSDNVGQYKINMYSGFTDYADKGLIEKIVKDLEDVFIGHRNEQGIFENGVLKTMYDYLVSDSNFNFIARMAVILYMAFLGLSFAIGSLEYNRKELMKILLKLTFVLAFTTSTSWQLYDRYIVRFFYDGFMSIIVVIGNLSSKLLKSENVIGTVNSASMASAFYFIDNIIITLFSKAITTKILGLFFGVWYGFIVIPIIYFLILRYIYSLVNAIFPYIVMFIQAIFALFFGPIFIVFSLFKTTEPLFKAWLTFLGGRFANMMFLFTVIYMFWMIIKQEFDSLLFFNSCKVPLWQAIFTDSGTSSDTIKAVTNFFSFGIEVWKANWDNLAPARTTPGFFSVCFSLIFIYFLIYLFDNVIKKLPIIVDSIFAVDGSDKGAGLNFSGQSKLGGKLGGLFDSLDNSIKIRGQGITKFARGEAIKFGKKVNENVLQPIKRRTIDKATNKIKDHAARPFDRLAAWSAQHVGESKKLLAPYNIIAALSPSVGEFQKTLIKQLPGIIQEIDAGRLTKEEALEKMDKIYSDFFDKNNKHGAFGESAKSIKAIDFHKRMSDTIENDDYNTQIRNLSSKMNELGRLSDKELLEKRKYYEQRKEFAKAAVNRKEGIIDPIAVARYDVILKRLDYEAKSRGLKDLISKVASVDEINQFLKDFMESSNSLKESLEELHKLNPNAGSDVLQRLKQHHERHEYDEVRDLLQNNDIRALSQDAKVKKEFYLDRATTLLSLAKYLEGKEGYEEILEQIKEKLELIRKEAQTLSNDPLVLTGTKDIEDFESRLQEFDQAYRLLSDDNPLKEEGEKTAQFLMQGGTVALVEADLKLPTEGGVEAIEGGMPLLQPIKEVDDAEIKDKDQAEKIREAKEKWDKIEEKITKYKTEISTETE